MEKENPQPAPARANVSLKALQRSVILAFKDSVRLQARTIAVSPFGFTMMSSWQIAKGKICEIEFDFLLNGKTRKINAISETSDSVCVGTQGFRTGLKFIHIESSSRQAINELMNFGA